MTPNPTQSPYPQVPLDEALARVAARAGRLPVERVPFEQSEGRILAVDVCAREAMPPFAASSRDGYAVIASDGAGSRRIVGDAVAGAAAAMRDGTAIRSGEVTRITTGAPLPAGADAVLMIEDTEPAADGHVVLLRGVASGENVRPVGQDYEADAVLLSAGTRVGVAALGLLASSGAVEVDVYRRPRVAVLSTGDELVEPGEALAPGQIRDSNRFALAAAAREAGAEVVRVSSIRDEEDQLDALRGASEEADVVLTSGGVSMGHRDLVKPWLASHGEIEFGRVRVKPGKPVTFARVGNALFFGLPGFPVSALVAFELFARPALRAMAGDPRPERPRVVVRLAHALDHAQDRDEIVRAFAWQAADGTLHARTTGFQGSGRLLSLHEANVLLRMPAGAGHAEQGASALAWVLAPLGRADDGGTPRTVAADKAEVHEGAVETSAVVAHAHGDA